MLVGLFATPQLLPLLEVVVTPTTRAAMMHLICRASAAHVFACVSVHPTIFLHVSFCPSISVIIYIHTYIYRGGRGGILYVLVYASRMVLADNSVILFPPPSRSPGSSLQGSQEEGMELMYSPLYYLMECIVLVAYVVCSNWKSLKG